MAKIEKQLIRVPGRGPFDAHLALVGEAPGKTEEKRGEPFVGETGRRTFGALDRYGFSRADVRVMNVCEYNIKPPTNLDARAAFVAKHRGEMDDQLAKMDPRVIIACGGLALQALTGRTNIRENWGAVILDRKRRCIVVPTIHPAAVMRTKIQAEKLLVEKALERACLYANGTYRYKPATQKINLNPDASSVNSLLNRSHEIVLDTEFNHKKRDTYLLGFTTDVMNRDEVIIITREALNGAYKAVLRKHLLRRDLLKVAHHHFADVESLSWWGLDVCEPFFDTMTGFATLYPDLPVGLSHVARYYLDDIDQWKTMEHTDIRYLGKDVSYTARSLDLMREEITDAGMWELIENEVVPTLPLLYGLQERGLQCDVEALRKVKGEVQAERIELLANIKSSVDGVFAKRREAEERRVAKNEAEIATIHRLAPRAGCQVHKDYNGLRKKRWAKSEQCTCQVSYDFAIAGRLREAIAVLRKANTSAKGKVKRWMDGFDPGNNDHVRWVLYDKRGFGLPPQKDYKTKRITVDATAVAKLISLKSVQRKTGVVEILGKIKRVQHLEKLDSTFYNPRLTGHGIVKVQYRMHGAGSGRPASGDDAYLHEKGSGRYKYNALNIPHKCRTIFVPHRPANEPVFINVDWVNLEGRLTAHFSGDKTLQRMLDEELKGGHKVHAQTAALLYNIDPADANTVKIILQGHETEAYNGGKRCRHAWHYGMKEKKMSQTFWISLKEAGRVCGLMSEMHPDIPPWWDRLGNKVFGISLYMCPKCEEEFTTMGECPECAAKGGAYIPILQWNGWFQEPTRMHHTPFGRRRIYLGRRSACMNALISQEPQGSGASMWYRTLGRLHGRDIGGGGWPVPTGVRVFDGRYGNLIRPRHSEGTDCETGTYDSFLLQTTKEHEESVLEWTLWTMEQEWPQLGGLRIPGEPTIGYNWGDYGDGNDRGLRERQYTPFTAGRPSGV